MASALGVRFHFFEVIHAGLYRCSANITRIYVQPRSSRLPSVGFPIFDGALGSVKALAPVPTPAPTKPDGHGAYIVPRRTPARGQPRGLKLSGRPVVTGLIEWCGRGDSNPHDLAAASPSSWCVCQFRHFRFGTLNPERVRALGEECYLRRWCVRRWRLLRGCARRAAPYDGARAILAEDAKEQRAEDEQHGANGGCP
jgi:hypothetical protein